MAFKSFRSLINRDVEIATVVSRLTIKEAPYHFGVVMDIIEEQLSGRSLDAGRYLGQVLPRLPNLTHLTVRGSNISWGDLKGIAQARGDTLEYLDFNLSFGAEASSVAFPRMRELVCGYTGDIAACFISAYPKMKYVRSLRFLFLLFTTGEDSLL